ncbi:MAG: ABC transporter substrate-binding protein [Eubacterium sp.]|nr:ABC transporter substrate-binding protein [Eubacterium sp.]
MNKIVKRVLATSMAVAMIGASFAGCKAKTDDATTTAAQAEAKAFKVGICQLVQHEALDAATKGFQEKLTELVEADGNKVEFDLKNASGEMNNCTTIATTFVSNNVDLIMANATPALQAAMTATATSQTPVVGTSVTDYGAALGIDISGDQATGINVTGASDLAPLSKQAEQITTLFPDAKKIGCIYCSSEANSVFQVNKIKEILEGSGLTVELFSFTDSNDISAVANKAATSSDVIYIPTDNKAADNGQLIGQICTAANVPIIAGESGIFSSTKAVATLSIDYYEMGQAAGEIAYNILAKGQDPKTTNIWLSPNATFYANEAAAKKFNVTIPEGYKLSE